MNSIDPFIKQMDARLRSQNDVYTNAGVNYASSGDLDDLLAFINASKDRKKTIFVINEQIRNEHGLAKTILNEVR